MSEDVGRVPDGTGLSSATPIEPASPSRPKASIPSRADAAKAYLVGSIDERKAVSQYLTVRAARACVRGNDLPWWAFVRRHDAHIMAISAAQSAREIESCEHVTDQAVWVVDLAAGPAIFAREAFVRDCRDAQPPTKEPTP